MQHLLVPFIIFTAIECFGYDKKFADHVKEEYINSFGPSEETKPFPKIYDPNKPFEVIKHFFKLSEINNIELSKREAQELSLKALEKDSKPQENVISENFVNKLNIVQATFARLITQPTNNVETIEERQAIIKTLIENEELLTQCNGYLEKFKAAESNLLNFFKPQEDAHGQLIQKLYFGTAMFNGKHNLGFWTRCGQMGKTLSCLLGLSSMLFVNVGYTIDYVNNNTNSYDAVDLATLFYANYAEILGGFLITDLKFNAVVIRYLQKQLIDVAGCIRNAQALGKLLENKVAPINLDNLRITHDDASAQFKQLINELLTSTFTPPASSVFSNVGRILATYKLMANKENNQYFNTMLSAVGELDVYVAWTKKIKECKSKPVHYSFVSFIEISSTPKICATKSWNPFVPIEKVVPNDFILSKETGQNYIMTGPNKGGKSTFMKQVSLNLLLAHTFGIAAADKFSCTPFAMLLIHMNENDSVGAGISHF